jgi:hypothetical protein
VRGCAATGGRPASAKRYAQSNAVKECGHGPGLADVARAPGQHQESGLEGVLRVLLVSEHVAADVPDQPGVAVGQSLERGRIARGRKPRKQLGIRGVVRDCGSGRTEEAADNNGGTGRHSMAPD